MIVDAHHHLWMLDQPGLGWLDDPTLAPIRRDVPATEADTVLGAASIDASVVVEARASFEETLTLLAIAEQHRARPAAVVGWLDLTGDVAAQLDAVRSAPGGRRLVGVRHQVQSEPDPAWLARADVLAGLRTLAEAGLAYDLVVRPDQLAACRDAAATVPALTFVLDHLGKPPIARGALHPWADDLRALARCPNVVAKVSGLVTEATWSTWEPADLAPYVDVAIDAFGPDRLLFGSDWPVCELAAPYDRVLAVAHDLLARCDPDAVFGATARHTYRMEDL